MSELRDPMKEHREMLEDESKQERFVVTDDQKAEWCIQQIKNAEEDKAFWKRFYDEQFRKVEESANATIENMKFMLQNYFSTVPHKVTDTQENYKLPSGKLVLKKQEPEYDRKEDEIIKWLKANDGLAFVKVKESLDWSGLKKTCTTIDGKVYDKNGEEIPGITVTNRPDVFTVEGVK